MNHDTNEPSKAPEKQTGRSREFERRLALLKTEVALDFPKLMPQLEAGRQVILVTDREFAFGLNPDVLRRFGGMMVLCAMYGAAVVFVNEGEVVEVSSEDRTNT